ncbi:MAG: VanZ family protein [candidate division Zixibacteria bacterium]|nr:VanZ family protein [candidate division Zixibacteria bacterium]
MTLKKGIAIVLSLVIIVALIFILEHLEPPANTFLWRELFNSGHTPLFGVLSLLFFTLSVNSLGRFVHHHRWYYLIAFMVTIITGVVSEFIQIFGSRDADIWDFNRDVAGAVVFLGLYATFDRQITRFLNEKIIRFMPAVRIGLVILFAVTFVPVLMWLGAYWHQSRIFPAICTFDSSWELKFLGTRRAGMDIIATPPVWSDEAGSHLARITYQPATYPDFEINEPYPDWSGHDSLVFTAFSNLDSTVRLSIRIEDRRHNHRFEDRYTGSFYVNKGVNHISIPLDEVARAPKTRTMDMTRIYAIHLYAYKIEDSLTVFFDNFYLK